MAEEGQGAEGALLCERCSEGNPFNELDDMTRYAMVMKDVYGLEQWLIT